MGQRIAIAGAGFSGAVIARALAEAGHSVTVHDPRPHVAGNCHTARDAATGILIHRYGPHIFHTDNDAVWDYVCRFARFRPYLNRVKSTVGGRVYALPVNLHTINQLYGLALDPAQARALIAAEALPIADPQNFEDQALAMIGPRLYEAFFKGYTQKQWGCSPRDLPAAILKRLPVRFSYDDNYFAHRHQGIPEEGYTALVTRILDLDGIDVHLGQALDPARAGEWDHVVWTGPLDAFFGHALGRLGYRTLDFDELRGTGDLQGCAVMNYGDLSVPWTRISEHKHFAPWESHADSVAYRETARDCGPADIPYYPIRLVAEKALLRDYVRAAEGLGNLTFAGRLGTYRYLDMDVTVAEALACGATLVAGLAGRGPLPRFAAPPL
jgi:UDP-galactopyranose mutase